MEKDINRNRLTRNIVLTSLVVLNVGSSALFALYQGEEYDQTMGDFSIIVQVSFYSEALLLYLLFILTLRFFVNRKLKALYKR